jgi:preprotein translocase subunit SecB
MTTESTPASAPSTAPDAGMPVTITAQYIKDFSFENPNAPAIFAATNAAPEIGMGVNVQTRGVAENTYEVLLALKLEAKLETKTAFIAELVYGGVFVLPKLQEEHLRLFLLVEAPRMLFPFARATLSLAIRDGGFPHVMINPIDFMSLYLANKDNVGSMPAAGAA